MSEIIKTPKIRKFADLPQHLQNQALSLNQQTALYNKTAIKGLETAIYYHPQMGVFISMKNPSSHLAGEQVEMQIGQSQVFDQTLDLNREKVQLYQQIVGENPSREFFSFLKEKDVHFSDLTLESLPNFISEFTSKKTL